MALQGGGDAKCESEIDSNSADARSVSSHNDRRSRCSFTGKRRYLRSSLASLDRFSDKLNDRMVDKMIKMIEDKKREERRENIVISGINPVAIASSHASQCRK